MGRLTKKRTDIRYLKNRHRYRLQYFKNHNTEYRPKITEKTDTVRSV